MTFVSTFSEFLREGIKNNLLRKGGAMVFWQITTLVLTFVSTVWIARCLGPLELGKSGFILVTGSQVLILISVCPNTYAVRITKNSTNINETIGIIVTGRTIASAVYLLVVMAAFFMGLIPAEWKFLAILGVGIPLFMALQPIWLYQAMEKQAAHFKASAIIALCVFLYAAVFIREGGRGIDEVSARLVAAFFGLWAGWVLTGFGNPLSYIKLKYAKTALKEAWLSRTLFGTQIVMYIIVGLELPLIAYLLNVEQLGMYRTATQLALGINTFVAMLPMIYYPRFIEWQKISSAYLWDKQRTMFLLGLGFVLPAAGLIMLIGPALYAYIFGATFKAAGVPFAILVCSKLVVMLGSIFAWGLWAKSKDLAILLVFTVVGVITVLSNLLFIPLYGMMAAACVNLLGQVCILGLTFYLAWKDKISRSCDSVNL